MDDYPYDLGPHSVPITTAVPEAQIWFDRGLLWTFGFNHEEAVRCFARAAEADPTAAMPHWGIAYATGPDYNMPWEVMDRTSRRKALATARAATLAALGLVHEAAPWEQALIRALPARYPQAEPPERARDMTPWNDAFAAAMREAHRTHPEHLDIAALFAEALMTRTPWRMWDPRSGEPCEGAATLEAREVLETALARPGGMAHPGLLHLHVHLMEMSPTPEAALQSADALREAVPDAGHLVHMATHIDIQIGAYRDAVLWNEKATRANLKYLAREGAMNLYTGYRLHDYHFTVYGALFLGQMEPALRALRGIEETTPPEMLAIESPPMADYFEAYLAMEPHVLIRFGRWQDLLALPLPEDRTLWQVKTATILYGRALALAALGRVDEALETETEFLLAAEAISPRRFLHVNRVVEIMEVAKAMLRGEILYREGAFDDAFAHLRRAVQIDDGLSYDEPWPWMQPPRHALGALLLEQGRVAEAEEVFRQDLGLLPGLPRAQIHPDNVWALKGLHDCLEARGATGETGDLHGIRQRLDIAMARADTDIAAACGCAQAAIATCCGSAATG